MKVRTVGALAALSMLLTSYSVWCLSAEGPRPKPRGGAVARTSPLRVDASPHDSSHASFTAGGTLEVAARLGHPKLPGSGSTETFVLIDVRADRLARGKPTPRELAIVIDRSGSMRGKRLSNAIAAAQGAVRRLADGDVVSVVDYATSAHVLVPPTTLDADSRERVSARIASLVAGGETCISCGLETARALLGQESDRIERVLLVSDGEATSGVRDVAGMRRVADGLRASGASVTTIGVDVDYNERLMTAIAEETNGRHYFVESPEGLAEIFDQELSGLQGTVAQNAKVELELATGVELVDVAGRSFERDGARVSVRLGAFSAGEERSVLARVRIEKRACGVLPVAAARLVYDDLATGARATQSGELTALFSDDGSRSPLDPIVEERVQRSGAVHVLNEANGLFEAGDAVGARHRVAEKLDEVRARRVLAVAAAPAPARAALSTQFDREEAALGAAASAFAQPPPAAASSPLELHQSKAALKKNAASAADLAY